jgi:outer membrane protein OmpA-like peptidoglycan-associated protein
MLTLPFAIQAQGSDLFNKVKSKIKQRTDSKVDKAIDKMLDKAEDQTAIPTQKDASPNSTTAPETTGQKHHSTYDFIPGEQILYNESFEQESIGELPAGWNTNGTGEVVIIKKYDSKWLRLHNPFVYLSANQKLFGENYTVEFDIIMQLKNNGWMYPEISVGLIGTNGEPATGNNFLSEYKKYAAVIATIMPGEYKSSKVKLNAYSNDQNYFEGAPKPFENLEQWYGTPVHVAIQVQKERFRMWINEVKLFDVPKGVPLQFGMNQLLFQVGRTNYSEEQYGVYINNIKVATGKADTRHKLIEEGRFSTTAILFDVNTATIKPQSGPVLKEIADVLNQAKNITIKIIGHTDSDGNDKTNLTLSQNRAAAVKDALVNEYGVSAARIKTEGHGENRPVADNKTKEGKAQNRRVEFVKE